MAFAPTLADIHKLIGPELIDKGFERRGNIYRKFATESVGLIDFQKSSSSSCSLLKFTVNIGVVLERLSLEDHFDPRRTKICDAHVRRRLGYFFDEKTDIWWTLQSQNDSEEICATIADVLVQRAIPAISKYMNVQEVIDLWKGGCAPGLTEVELKRNLKILENE